MANCGLKRDDVGCRTLFRMPKDIKAWIDREAALNGSSQNSEIIRSIRFRMDAEQSKKAAG
jgi:hypothetical protein